MVRLVVALSFTVALLACAPQPPAPQRQSAQTEIYRYPGAQFAQPAKHVQSDGTMAVFLPDKREYSYAVFPLGPSTGLRQDITLAPVFDEWNGCDVWIAVGKYPEQRWQWRLYGGSIDLNPVDPHLRADGILYVALCMKPTLPVRLDYITVLGNEPPNKLLVSVEREMWPPATRYTVTVSTTEVTSPFAYMTGIGVAVKQGNHYAQNSFNVGAPGNPKWYPDGIWEKWPPSDGEEGLKFLEAPDHFIVETDMPLGYTRIDFNLTPISQWEMYWDGGALFNFQVDTTCPSDIVLVPFDGVARTYYSDAAGETYTWDNVAAWPSFPGW